MSGWLLLLPAASSLLLSLSLLQTDLPIFTGMSAHSQGGDLTLWSAPFPSGGLAPQLSTGTDFLPVFPQRSGFIVLAKAALLPTLHRFISFLALGLKLLGHVH